MGYLQYYLFFFGVTTLTIMGPSVDLYQTPSFGIPVILSRSISLELITFQPPFARLYQSPACLFPGTERTRTSPLSHDSDGVPLACFLVLKGQGRAPFRATLPKSCLLSLCRKDKEKPSFAPAQAGSPNYLDGKHASLV